MTWRHEQPYWPKFTWDEAALALRLTYIRHRQGGADGPHGWIRLNLKREACLATITNDVVKNAAIEGEKLSPEEVRSSIAPRLGIDVAGLVPANRDAEGIVEMMLDAAQHFRKPLTSERLFDWQAGLFPTGRSGQTKITVGTWRPESAGATQVISGPIGREKAHFEASCRYCTKYNQVFPDRKISRFRGNIEPQPPHLGNVRKFSSKSSGATVCRSLIVLGEITGC